MTPQFNSKFKFLTDVIDVFNQRCSCQKVDLRITFQFIADVRDFNTDPANWLATVQSEVFGKERYGGTADRVVELVNKYVDTLAAQLIEAMVANADEWFKDAPHLKQRVTELFDALNGTGDS